MDQSDIVADIDYSIDTFVPQKRAGNWFTDVLGGQSPQNLAAVTQQFKFAPTALRYGTELGSQQTRMLAEQDSWF